MGYETRICCNLLTSQEEEKDVTLGLGRQILGHTWKVLVGVNENI